MAFHSQTHSFLSTTCRRVDLFHLANENECEREKKKKEGKYLGGREAASFRDRKQATPIFTLVEHIGLRVLHRVLRFESNEQRNKEDKKNVECDSQLDYIR